MDLSTLTKEERLVYEHAHGNAPAVPVAPVVPKTKWMPSPEHLAKLAAARIKYQADLKAGLIKPAVRVPKPSPEVVKAENQNPSAADREVAAEAVRKPTVFSNIKTRYEFFTRDGDFDTDLIPCLYVTEVRPNKDAKGFYEIQNLAGEWLTVGGKWLMKSPDHEESVRHYYEVPHWRVVQEALRLVNLELDMEFTL